MSEQKIVTELKISGHLMRLDSGLYCVFHAPNGHRPDQTTGLPGVRISLPPGDCRGVEIGGFREDGWVSTDNDAALIRISEGPAQVLVTVYQSAHGGDALPQLQIVRLGDFRPSERPAASAPPAAKEQPAVPSVAPEAVAPKTVAPAIIAHVQQRGDVGGRFGEWVGERGSKLWIEGFSITPPAGLPPEDIEYQAVLGRGWLSPWSQGGQFCGSRRMALPILGFRVRLRGAAAEAFSCTCSASFTDGAMVGPTSSGESCEVEGLAPLEAFQVTLQPRGKEASPPGMRDASPKRPDDKRPDRSKKRQGKKPTRRRA
ncbi:MAG TPA: hypothetical protein VMA37_18525 [Acetobacteraceae bacterium]|nr:hypothetical protein [Acetobacteraceae bacterium]